jgi:hypothetical protein
MPKYQVTLFYHASASYDVEAADEGAALEEVDHQRQEESSEEFFRDRLILDYTDSNIEEDKED